MRASTAIDAFSGPTVQYYFANITDSNHDSGWVASPVWTDPGLNTGTRYGYQVKARDTHNNETGYSIIGYAIAGDDTTPPTPNPMTWATVPYATSTSSIRMVATTATDDTSGVEYYFDCSSPAPGHNSGWVTSSTYTDSGLLPNTLYKYRVKARDLSSHHNETGYSVLADANTGQIVTPPPTDVNAPTPNPSQWAAGGTPHYVTSDGITFTLTMTAATATDTQSPPVWYYFNCTNAGSSYNSGWTLNPTWTKDFIAQGYLVYRVYTKDSASTPN
jgi:hypothetical protein